MGSTRPWWDTLPQQYQHCRAARQECQFKEVCHRECRYEVSKDGTDCKKCVTKMQLLRLCPGSNDWEKVTSQDLQETEQGPSLSTSSQQLPAHPAQGAANAPVQPEIGQQWEDFLRYALELQRQLALESRVSLEPEPPLPRHRVKESDPEQNKSMLNRLFRRNAPAPGTKYNFAKLWKDYAAYGSIEEV